MSIAEYAYRAGFRGDDLVTAVAVAYAESGGDPSNYNPEIAAGTPEGQGSYGLWQIYRKSWAKPRPRSRRCTRTETSRSASVAIALGVLLYWLL